MWLSQIDLWNSKQAPNARYSPFSQPDSDLRRSEKEISGDLKKKLDWTGMEWTGLDWTGLDWTGLDCPRGRTVYVAGLEA